MGYVYKQLKEEMKFLWSPKLKRNSIHTEDAAGALWAAARSDIMPVYVFIMTNLTFY